MPEEAGRRCRARPRGLVCHQEAVDVGSLSNGKPSMGLRRERPAGCVLESAVQYLGAAGKLPPIDPSSCDTGWRARGCSRHRPSSHVTTVQLSLTTTARVSFFPTLPS